jgi:hypothetical protein
MVEHKIEEYQNQLRDGNSLCIYDNDVLKYVQRPIGKEIYKNAIERNIKKEKIRAKPNDRIECKICGKMSSRANMSAHNKTEKCMIYSKINIKLRNLLIE